MSNDAIFYVYVLFRLSGMPLYVGKGKGNRWVSHEALARHYNPHLGRIIEQARMLGKELPKVKVRTNITEAEAFETEKALIATIGRESRGGPLVNLTDGGEGVAGLVSTPEHRAKLSAALKDKPKSPAHIAAAAAGRRGKSPRRGWWSTEEGRAKQRANNPGHTGHHHSEETIAEIKSARARQPRHISVATQFKSGLVPWNKGLDGYNPSPSTQFRPGHQPSEATRAKLSISIAKSWAKRKAVSNEQSLNEGASL